MPKQKKKQETEKVVFRSFFSVSNLFLLMEGFKFWPIWDHFGQTLASRFRLWHGQRLQRGDNTREKKSITYKIWTKEYFLLLTKQYTKYTNEIYKISIYKNTHKYIYV